MQGQFTEISYLDPGVTNWVITKSGSGGWRWWPVLFFGGAENVRRSVTFFLSLETTHFLTTNIVMLYKISDIELFIKLDVTGWLR